MWNDSYALPSPPAFANFGVNGHARHRPRTPAVTSRRTRLKRWLRLSAHLIRMWIGARLTTLPLAGRKRQRLVRAWATRMLEVLEISVVVRGDAPPADWRLLLVANHISWVDTYVLNTLSPARFVAKAEVRRWPLIGTIAERVGTFFLVRGSCRAAARMKTTIARALGAGEPVGVFPEGTTTDGAMVRTFHPAMFQAAIDADVLVQPVAIRYLTAAGARTAAAAYIDDMTIADSLHHIFALPRLIVEVTFCAPMFARGRTRRTLARQAHASISTTLGLAVAPGMPTAPRGIAPHVPDS